MQNSIRFIPNKYNLSTFNEGEILSKIKHNLNSFTASLKTVFASDCKQKIYSTGKKKTDFSIYSGTGGNIYLYWRYYLYNKEELSNFKLAFDTNLDIVENYQKSSGFNLKEEPTAFFHGTVGVYTMGCLLAKELKDHDVFEENLTKVLKFKSIALSDNSEDELLYGNAGYLYSLLLIHKQCAGTFNFNIEQDIYEIFKFLIQVGVQKQKERDTNYLVYPFPRNKKGGKVYLGAAHGVFGVLYELLSAIKLFPDFLTSEVTEILIDSLVRLSKLQLKSGNFPSSLKDLKSDELVHFCHGAVGAVYLYCLANELFPERNFLDTAVKCGEVIWERGLLKKGNGICHGIAGNAYALFKLYDATGKEDYRKKGLYFAYATADEELQGIIRNYHDDQRMQTGVPDTPYSLMEGIGGTLCMYIDILNNDRLFPGFEI